MTDVLAVTSAIQALKAASDMIKGLRGADLNLEKAELKMRLADLGEQLVNARAAVMDAQQLIIDQQEKIRALEAANAVAGRLEFRDNVYYLANQGGQPEAYCPRCYDATQRLIHLSRLPAHFRDSFNYTCANCKGTF